MKEKMVASLPDARGGEEEAAASEVPALLPLLLPSAVAVAAAASTCSATATGSQAEPLTR